MPKVNKLKERARVGNEHSHVNSAATDKLLEENFLIKTCGDQGWPVVGVCCDTYELYHSDKGHLQHGGSTD